MEKLKVNVRNWMFIVAVFLSNVAFAELSCIREKVFQKEIEALGAYQAGSIESVGAFLFEDKFLPLPARFSAKAPSRMLAYSSAVLPPGSSYFGCKAQYAPRGLIEAGVIDDCEYCAVEAAVEVADEDSVKKIVEGKYTLLTFKVDEMMVSIVYSKDAYIQIMDHNNGIIQVWWHILQSSYY